MTSKAPPAPIGSFAPGLEPLLVPLVLLDLLEGNPRRGDVAAVVRSYEQFGQRKPIVARHLPDGRCEVTAGNTQLQAATQLGWSHIAVVWADDDDLMAKAWALADNRTSDLGLYDEAALVAYLEAVKAVGSEDLFAATGYSEADLAAYVAHRRVYRTSPNQAPPVPATPQSEPGQLYQLGSHRVLCGDSRVPADVARVMGSEKATLIYTDPPYGVGYGGGRRHTPGSPHVVHQGDKSRGEELVALYSVPFEAAKAHGTRNCACLVWYADAKGLALYTALERSGWEARSALVWVKNNAQWGALGAQYHQGHEPLMYCVKPGRSPKWYGGTTEQTVWLADRANTNEWHPTQKPVEVGERAMANHTQPLDVVLDLYGGSGSTLIAAEVSGRLARLIEIDPGFVDVICRRWQEFTGLMPSRDGQPVSFT